MGAAIAAGSQLENGIWALLVMAATVIEKIIIEEKELIDILVINQCPWFTDHAIESKISTSPIRFLRAVIMPAAKDFGFW